jgi:hypothetical protein
VSVNTRLPSASHSYTCILASSLLIRAYAFTHYLSGYTRLLVRAYSLARPSCVSLEDCSSVQLRSVATAKYLYIAGILLVMNVRDRHSAPLPSHISVLFFHLYSLHISCSIFRPFRPLSHTLPSPTIASGVRHALTKFGRTKCHMRHRVRLRIQLRTPQDNIPPSPCAYTRAAHRSA